MLHPCICGFSSVLGSLCCRSDEAWVRVSSEFCLRALSTPKSTDRNPKTLNPPPREAQNKTLNRKPETLNQEAAAEVEPCPC